MSQAQRSQQLATRGFSLIEILIALMMIGILAAILIPSVQITTRPLEDSTNRLAGAFKLVRAKAMSQTSAYRIRANPSATATQFLVEFSNSCNSTAWTSDPSFNAEDVTLAQNIEFSTVTANPSIAPWSICFNSRGIADRTLAMTLRNTQDSSQTQIVRVFQGGSVQIDGQE